MIIEEINQRLFPNDSFHLEQTLKNNPNNFRVVVIYKGTEKERIIFIPKMITKYCQRYILKEYLLELKPSDFCLSYRSNISIKKNALVHRKGKYFLHLDIKHFFNNMTWPKFCEIVNKNFPDSRFCKLLDIAEDNNFLKNVLTYKNRIVQGSVSSPHISNLYLYDFDLFVKEYIDENNLELTYTRYSDDIYFSSNSYIKHDLIDVLDSKLRQYNLRLNFSKIKFTRLKTSVRLTGLSINKDRRVVLPTKYKKKIKKHIYYFISKSMGDKDKLIGELSYLKTNDRAYYRKLCIKYSNSFDLINYIKKFKKASEVNPELDTSNKKGQKTGIN